MEPALSRGLFWLPHFGDWTHEGQPSAQVHEAIASRVAGLSLALGWGWAMGGGAAGTLTLAVGAIAAMSAVAGIAALVRRGV